MCFNAFRYLKICVFYYYGIVCSPSFTFWGMEKVKIGKDSEEGGSLFWFKNGKKKGFARVWFENGMGN